MIDPVLPDKKDIKAIFTFLSTCSDSRKKYQAKHFFVHAVFGLFLDICYKDFYKNNNDESWEKHIKKHFKISESHSRNLRSVGRLVDTYTKLQKLSITFRDFIKLKKPLIRMKEIEEYKLFWKSKQQAESRCVH